MRKSLTTKATAVITMAAMLTSMAACGANESAPADNTQPEASTDASVETAAADASEEAAPSDEYDPYQVITDDAGNPIDLGGMDIIIRDWWSGDEQEPQNDYEEALKDYRDWIQETYNFTIKSQAISDWGSTPQDFVDYVTTGGDDVNYLFVLRDDPAITSAMANGLLYDLSTLDCLDFNDIKFQRNLLHEQYSKGDSIYAMFAGYSEARTGVYFNKRLLTEAGIDPDSIYDMQADGSWTWDKFDELMSKVQQDKDNDGTVDVWGLTLNEGVMTTEAVFSNGGSYIDKDASGKYVYNLESPETLEALEWTVDMYKKYDMPDPEGAEWDYYKEAFINGMAAFMVEDEYAGAPGNFLEDMQDDVGFVMFPKGPKMNDYINVWTNNPVAIPGCYDADRAWKLAFAWNLYTNPPAAEYYDYNGYLSTARNGKFDERAVDETITMMTEKGTIAYHGMIPNLSLGSDFVWNITADCVVSEQVEAIRDTWKAYVDEANAQ
ncbi:ABC-type glycerol-3-phosphate transport system, substrate-binding protein [Butyrivibrio sp. INlla18]|uniref:ABC transporter substrate-binding protein n=1 Tax=Butyrivibrio sp. INlla18 TaxID=1520806 RepID=UPI00088A4131|nr:extracellular solute-binding protein [Butyrivibrio sp. INlla18]SDA58144.1 ABC-type glycerol-3-phosphate transport system, substrate-binding protein [Butyrivibrio sp. INlla18]